MKRFAPILLAFLCLTACPQVGPSLAPGVFAAGGPAPSEDAQNSAVEDLSPEDSVSEDLPSDAAPPAPEAVLPPSDPAAPSAPPPPAPQEDVTGGGAAPSDSGFVAVSDPIDPKSDERVIDHPKIFYYGLRLQYGPDFENTLDPDAADLPDIPRDTNGKIHLSAEAQVKWHKHSDWKDSPKGSVVRMVFRPQDESSKTKYCDARVSIDSSEEEGGNVLFSGLSAGPGRLDFYHMTPVFRKFVKEDVNSTSDPIAPCESGWQTLDRERHLKDFWDFLGSFNSVPQDGNP